jgi:predicted GIY-YIG superfamily endonuclease
MEKQYIYIIQASAETSRCKIGRTENLKERLKQYNSTTGKSNLNKHNYLFTCEVKDMKQVEKDIKTEFKHLREEENREIYFYNSKLFNDYVKYIKSHKYFIKETFIKTDENKEIIKIVKKQHLPLKIEV